MTIFELLFRFTRKVVNSISACYDKIATTFIFKGNGVSYSTFRTTGIPYVVVATGGIDNVGRILINKDLSINNGIKGNPIGSYRRCTFFCRSRSHSRHRQTCGIIANRPYMPLEHNDRGLCKNGCRCFGFRY